MMIKMPCKHSKPHKKMKSDFSEVRKEAKDWVSGMGNSVTDADASKRIWKSANKNQMKFVGEQKKSLSWSEF